MIRFIDELTDLGKVTPETLLKAIDARLSKISDVQEKDVLKRMYIPREDTEIEIAKCNAVINALRITKDDILYVVLKEVRRSICADVDDDEEIEFVNVKDYNGEITIYLKRNEYDCEKYVIDDSYKYIIINQYMKDIDEVEWARTHRTFLHEGYSK